MPRGTKTITEEQRQRMEAGRKKRLPVDERAKEMMRKDYREDEPLIRSKAIKEKCMNCCGWQRVEVLNCTSYACPLWPHRLSSKTLEKFKKEIRNG